MKVEVIEGNPLHITAFAEGYRRKAKSLEIARKQMMLAKKSDGFQAAFADALSVKINSVNALTHRISMKMVLVARALDVYAPLLQTAIDASKKLATTHAEASRKASAHEVRYFQLVGRFTPSDLPEDPEKGRVLLELNREKATMAEAERRYKVLTDKLEADAAVAAKAFTKLTMGSGLRDGKHDKADRDKIAKYLAIEESLMSDIQSRNDNPVGYLPFAGGVIDIDNTADLVLANDYAKKRKELGDPTADSALNDYAVMAAANAATIAASTIAGKLVKKIPLPKGVRRVVHPDLSKAPRRVGDVVDALGSQKQMENRLIRLRHEADIKKGHKKFDFNRPSNKKAAAAMKEQAKLDSETNLARGTVSTAQGIGSSIIHNKGTKPLATTAINWVFPGVTPAAATPQPKVSVNTSGKPVVVTP